MSVKKTAPDPGVDPGVPEISDADLKRYGIATSSELQDTDHARVMVLGASGCGKTTTCLTTSPPPILVINCDGPGAAIPAVREGGEFFEITARTRNSWKAACEAAVALSAAGKVNTVVVDTFTLLADEIVAECALTLDGYDLWREVFKWLSQGIRRLKQVEAHLIVVCHMDPTDDEIAGITPMLPGKIKGWLAPNLADKVLFEYDHESGRRQFLVGPQKYWSHSGRKVKRSCVVGPSIKDLLTELGVKA